MKKLFTICLVLLFCTSVYGVKVSSRDDSTAIATMQVDVTASAILNSDQLALLGIGTGDVFYVDSGATGSGTAADWTNADITIELALVHCTANAGDIIVCAPYHAETASTGTFDLDLDGVTLIGLGKGDAMTTITYDTTTDTVIMGASGDGCTIRNIKFIATVTAVANAIVVEAGCTDFVIEDCVFENETSTTDEFIDAILVSGTLSDRGIIRNNRFLGDVGANAGPKSSINFVDCDYLEIYGNQFSGDIGDAHIFNETTASNYISIHDNRIMCGFIGADSTNLDVTPGISLFATTTGWIQDNFVVTNVATPDLSIVAADCYLSGNTYTETQGAAAGSVPVGTASVGERCVKKSLSTIANGANNIFAVSGGPIKMTEFVIYIDSVTETKATLIGGNIDPTTPATDTVFGTDGTAVDFTNSAAGTVYTWDGVLATDFAKQANGVVLAMGTDVSYGMFVPVGMIELTSGAAATGTLTVYMTYLPLGPDSIVTPQ